MKRIIVENVSKKFMIGRKDNRSTLARFISFFSGREPKKVIWALKNISLSVDAGEILGVIGRNGSGKSTLLRVIPGIYDIDGGEIKTEGKIVSLINLHIGLRDRLTMEQNIYACCPLFGLSYAEIKIRYHSIVRFSGLERFVNTKLYQFSQGMRQRLSFSMALYCDADIFLIDEVFEVGDEEFRNNSMARIEELIKKGASILLVSHELPMLEKHCDRVIWLDNGKLIKEGPAKEVIKDYLG
ncbi:MAG: ABC transporter ATP-binding protein [Candidatus Omnitrophica bacterium]|nr:ABC transporter ATP-binding protein [Candidatus Omnitrophota bacterium]